MIDTVLVGAGWSQQLPAPDQELGDVTMPSIPHHNSLHLHTVPCWEHLHCRVSKHRGGISSYKLTSRCHSLSPLSPDVPSLELWELKVTTLHPACCLLPGLGWNHKLLQPRLCRKQWRVWCRGHLCHRYNILYLYISAVSSSRWRQQTAAGQLLMQRVSQCPDTRG